MKFYNIIFLLFAVSNLSAQANQENLFVITNPVVDIGNRYHPIYGNAASLETGKCYRAHQGLFNEIVNGIQIAEEDEHQMQIYFDNIIYGFDIITGQPLNTFYMYSENLIPLRDLSEQALETIPSPEYAKTPTIVLTWPWNGLSIGTRLAHMPELDTQDAYAVKIYNHNNQSIIHAFIDRQNALTEMKKSEAETRKLFVSTINTLIDRVCQNEYQQVIPCIWGGSSFINSSPFSDFYQEDGLWHRNSNTDPYTGYDASEFVMRMAKIAGINFPWKTTAVIGNSLQAFDEQDQLEEGDLIWVPGHVLIVTNLERNEITTSRGYTSGYGCVHRITLSECFDGITTFEELLNRYRAQETNIQYKNKDGSIAEKIYDFKLLKLLPSNK